MSYIKLEVRSGGIYIRTKKISKNSTWVDIKNDLASHPKDNQQKVLSLIRDSSIKGLFSYLIGETKKIKEIESSPDFSIKKLNLTLDKMVQASAYKKMTEPHITTFFERKDTHSKESNFSPNPSVNLYNYSFQEAEPTLKLFEKPLKKIFKTNCLGKINEEFRNSKITPETQEYKNLKTPKCNNIPDTDLGKKIKGYFDKIKTKKNPKPIYKKTIEIINEANSLCLKDTKFKEEFEKFSNSQFNNFEVGHKKKQWLDKNYHPIVRGTPAYIACVDFDIYLSELAFIENQNSDHFTWDEIVDKIKQGPNMARWGEGGIVFIDYSGLDEIGCPHENKDAIFVEIKALRNAGLKIKKYDWEPDKKNYKNKG